MLNEESFSELLEEAVVKFYAEHFEIAFQKFSEYQDLGRELENTHLIAFLTCTLKVNRPHVEIGDLNPNYIHYTILKKGLFEKSSTSDIAFEDIDNINKLLIYEPYYKIGFGIYEGVTIQTIANDNPGYLLWCIINLLHFSISPLFFLQKGIKEHNDYFRALEINLVKIELLKSWLEEVDKYIELNDSYNDYDDYQEAFPSYENWLVDEFGDDAEIAYWNMD